jgi:uncharacterized protein
MIKINKNIISKQHKTAITPIQKAIGLMFKTKVKQPLIFIFNNEAIISIHMLFVFMAIDLIFLNKDKKIVELKQNLQPFTFYTPTKKAKYLIEAKKGTIKTHNIKLSQQVIF